MAYDQRLPNVNSDDGSWGNILNQFLSLQHVNTGVNAATNGSHQVVTIAAGTTTAGTAPLKFAAGSLLTTPEAGAIEFDGNKLYLTQTSGTTRKVVAAFDDSAGVVGDTYYRDANGYIVRVGIGTTGQVLTSLTNGSNLVPTWVTPAAGGSGLTQQQVMGISSMRI